MNLLSYILQVIAASGLFYAYYFFALKNRKFHQYNRFYLLLSVVFSLVVPFLNIPIYFSGNETIIEGKLTEIYFVSGQSSIDGTIVSENNTLFSLKNFITTFYLTVSAILLIRMISSLIKIRKIINSHQPELIGDIKWMNTEEPGTPYSFFRWLFWNKKLELNSESGKQVFRHEIYHIRQKHSIDVVMIEVINMLFWINPFFHLIKKELRAIHEFLADQFAMKGNEGWKYAELLLMQALQTKQSIVNPFFHNQIKRRIAMITNPKKTSHQYLRQLLALPLIAVVIMLFAFSYRSAQEKDASNFNSEFLPINDTVPTVKIVEGYKRQPQKKLTPEMLEDFKDENVYGVWIDGKRVKNSELNKYKASHFAEYNVSKLHKNAVNYGKHYFQVNLYTQKISSEERQETPLMQYERKILSLQGVDNPLFVIDGKVAENVSFNNIGIAPEEIASITILKNKSAVDLYGEKGANGVILITTKTNQIEEVTVVGKKREVLKEVPVEEVTVVGKQTGVVNPREKPDEIREEPVETVVVGYQVFQKAEIEPQFPGGDAALRKFLQDNINKSVNAMAPKGDYSVVLSLFFDESGKITSIKPITKFGYGMEEEAVRVMKKSPDWLPAKQGGRTVKFHKKLVITFQSNSVITRIRKSELLGHSIASYLGVPENAEIARYTFTMDLDNGDLVALPQSSHSLNNKAKDYLEKSEPGKLITFDNIVVKLDGAEKRIPSKIFTTID